MDKIGAELEIEFSKAENVNVAHETGYTMTATTGSDVITYSCNVYSAGSMTFVFEVSATKAEAFDIKVLVDDKLIGSKIMDF